MDTNAHRYLVTQTPTAMIFSSAKAILLCFALLAHPNSGHSSPPLILHLKAKQLISTARPPSSKLSFHQNVSLTVTLSVGTPPQQAIMVLDTGSELSWLHCTKSPLSFTPRLSTTYHPITCSSPTCTTRTRDLTTPPSCDPNNHCRAVISYADATSVEGTLATDIFRLGGSSTFDDTVFGCMDSGSTSNPDEDSKSTGLIGMNRGSLSFVSQMGFRKFSYCISSQGSSGVLLLGESGLPWMMPLNYTPMVQMKNPSPYFDRTAYTVQLEGIRVNGMALKLPKSVFVPDNTGAGQTMIDSGTQFTFLLGPVYTALRSEFSRQTKGVLSPLNDFVFEGAMDLCYRVSGSLPRLPSVTLVFGGAEMTVSGEKLMYKVPGTTRNRDSSVYCFTFGNSELLGLEAYVIGHYQQQDMWVEFDLRNQKVGLAGFRCDLARQKLGLSP